MHFYTGNNWFPTLDPEFDELGGELTFHQITDPLPEPDEEPKNFYARRWQQLYDARLYRRRTASRALRRAIRNVIHYKRVRLNYAYERFQHALPNLNKKCSRCYPYNGHHTPNYWGTGQADCW